MWFTIATFYAVFIRISRSGIVTVYKIKQICISNGTKSLGHVGETYAEASSRGSISPSGI